MTSPDNLHASAVALGGKAVLLLGESGAGKSSLALRLIKEEGARLIADDRVLVQESEGAFFVSPPDALAGLIEMRGLGLVVLPYEKKCPLHLVVELCARGDEPRLASVDHWRGDVARIKLYGFDALAPLRVKTALAFLSTQGFSESGIYGEHSGTKETGEAT